jgi:hypothetical protein
MLLRDVLKPALSCTEVTGVTLDECVACARSAASRYVAAGCGSLVRPTIGRTLPIMPPTTPAPFLSASANLSPPISPTGSTGEGLSDAVERSEQAQRRARRENGGCAKE